MTNASYFKQLLGFAASSDTVEAAMTDIALNANDSYVTSNKNALKTAAIEVLKLLLSTPDTEQGTGDTTNKISFDRAAIKDRILLLENDLGITTNTPSIKGVSVW